MFFVLVIYDTAYLTFNWLNCVPLVPSIRKYVKFDYYKFILPVNMKEQCKLNIAINPKKKWITHFSFHWWDDVLKENVA